MLKSEKRKNKKGVNLMPNHFDYLSDASKMLVQMPFALTGKINRSSTGYKSVKCEKLHKARLKKTEAQREMETKASAKESHLTH